jgi:surfactin synthase thioesterase subunit
MFRDWTALLPPSIEIAAVQLPGRETRIAESPETSLDRLVARITAAIGTEIDVPFAFFGHSMGALLAYEVARELEASGRPVPHHLFVSSFRAPHIESTHPGLHLLDEEPLLAMLGRLGGSDGALDNGELRAIFLPIIRADLAICDGYKGEVSRQVPCRVTALGGLADTFVPPAQLRAWRAYSLGEFRCVLFNGGHFYLNEHRHAIADLIVDSLANWAVEPAHAPRR